MMMPLQKGSILLCSWLWFIGASPCLSADTGLHGSNRRRNTRPSLLRGVQQAVSSFKDDSLGSFMRPRLLDEEQESRVPFAAPLPTLIPRMPGKKSKDTAAPTVTFQPTPLSSATPSVTPTTLFPSSAPSVDSPMGTPEPSMGVPVTETFIPTRSSTFPPTTVSTTTTGPSAVPVPAPPSLAPILTFVTATMVPTASSRVTQVDLAPFSLALESDTVTGIDATALRNVLQIHLYNGFSEVYSNLTTAIFQDLVLQIDATGTADRHLQSEENGAITTSVAFVGSVSFTGFEVPSPENVQENQKRLLDAFRQEWKAESGSTLEGVQIGAVNIEGGSSGTGDRGGIGGVRSTNGNDDDSSTNKLGGILAGIAAVLVTVAAVALFLNRRSKRAEQQRSGHIPPVDFLVDTGDDHEDSSSVLVPEDALDDDNKNRSTDDALELKDLAIQSSLAISAAPTDEENENDDEENANDETMAVTPAEKEDPRQGASNPPDTDEGKRGIQENPVGGEISDGGNQSVAQIESTSLNVKMSQEVTTDPPSSESKQSIQKEVSFGPSMKVDEGDSPARVKTSMGSVGVQSPPSNSNAESSATIATIPSLPAPPVSPPLNPADVSSSPPKSPRASLSQPTSPSSPSKAGLSNTETIRSLPVPPVSPSLKHADAESSVSLRPPRAPTTPVSGGKTILDISPGGGYRGYSPIVKGEVVRSRVDEIEGRLTPSNSGDQGDRTVRAVDPESFDESPPLTTLRPKLSSPREGEDVSSSLPPPAPSLSSRTEGKGREEPPSPQREALDVFVSEDEGSEGSDDYEED